MRALSGIDRYEIVNEIARGGMGVVYRARDRASGEMVALKYLEVGERRNANLLLECFEREYQVLAGLEHPRIIRVFDYARTQGGAYYTMELLEGSDLGRATPIPWREACQYLRDVATSLSLLHARRLVHRDLSPGNVKLTEDGHCKLIDFGALTDFGPTETLIGTPPFIAPDAVTEGHLDQRVDLYALGALGYYCLTGQHAYPARCIDELLSAWDRLPARPSDIDPDIPGELDALLMSLLSQAALARPASAAEVIMRLDAIADLPPDDDASQRLLAQSFLVAPRYVGRQRELAYLEDALRASVKGQGRAVRVHAAAGAGRSRLLEETAVRAALAGATVARADASAQPGHYGAVRALARTIFESCPDLAREAARDHGEALRVLGDVRTAGLRPEERHPLASRQSLRPSAPPARQPQDIGVAATPPAVPAPSNEAADGETVSRVEDWLLEVARARPLVLLVDNVEHADDASLGVLLALCRAAPRHSVLLVLTEQSDGEEDRGLGLAALGTASETLSLDNLSLAEMADLLRSIFGDTPRVARLAEWLHAETAGRPLHTLGIVRQLASEGVIRNERGVWVLPSSRPHTHLSEQLEDALARRIGSLSLEALTLARCLSLHRGDLTLALARQLTDDSGSRGAIALLDELSAHDVLHRDHERCFFSSAALRQTLLKRMGGAGRRASHLRLGHALAALNATRRDLGTVVDAGWHLIRGGEEMSGADMIAEVTQDSVACNLLVANLYRMGEPVEAALRVYRAARKSQRERLPLLTALAQAGYYEHYHWAERYGDEALDVVEKYSGLGLARRLTPFLGRHLGFVVAFGIAAAAHYLSPRRVRGGSFINLLVHVCCTVTSLCGVAAIQLDAERCDRVARTMVPVSALPRRVALVGIYHFCVGLQHIAREHQVEAYRRFTELAARFGDPKYYWFMPPGAHVVYEAGSQFARGAFAMMRNDGDAALQSAVQLERQGLPLYGMIASQIRYLYHLNRGDLARAQVHRERVEVHAARVGYAWQVELWEPASLLPYYVATHDVVELSRIAHRLGELGESVGSMWRYRELADLASCLHIRRSDLYERAAAQINAEPRSFIGWSTTLAAVALHRNQAGEYAEARELCQRVLETMNDEDRACVMIFLQVDLQAAIADAGLGRTNEAVARLDRLAALHAGSDHPLALGLIHESRARIAFAAGRKDLYRESLREATRWLQPTGTPALVAMCDRLAHLDDAASRVSQRNPLRVWEDLSTETSEAGTRVARPATTGQKAVAGG